MNEKVIQVTIQTVVLTRASLIPVSLVFGRSNTRKAAKLAVYEATIIMANPAHTIPKTLAEKLRGVPENTDLSQEIDLNIVDLPSPMPLLSNTPQANQIALERLRASSSVPSVLASLNLPKGENRSNKYKTSATTCTDTITKIHKVLLNGCKNDTKVEDLDGCKTSTVDKNN